ncbi:HTH-type transcriptional repressor ComR [Zhongshania aliphaticivorans]|uniref:HTH-type transcriptional repressor ComR n=1 Tax=Zhongshania aliphaticivorans TaxID=1470434 RepID=A0A5S9MU37_9GAMM|nr:TetR/AcrR family transcriptional regulator [Zhongshania aliphaticivorans]CAA0080425.1 HTH-type transcriptional repressor ComR [Zhongshania aliphaticivorans]CAA0085685.1 HTH-type transcriptional repressor ComR [Zhongshania aliphaticivorans]
MPWEKSFDEDVVLEKAMRVFWRKGYDAASMANLIEETGINKGSLYNTFGGKQALFVKTLLKYDLENRSAMLASLEALDNPRQAVSQFFDNIVNSTVADEERKGCFLFNTVLDCGSYDAETNAIVANGLREIEGFFRRSIEVGQMRGEINKELNPESKAKAMLGLALSIRVLGRGAYTDSALKTLANEAKQLIM